MLACKRWANSPRRIFNSLEVVAGYQPGKSARGTPEKIPSVVLNSLFMRGRKLPPLACRPLLLKPTSILSVRWNAVVRHRHQGMEYAGKWRVKLLGKTLESIEQTPLLEQEGARGGVVQAQIMLMLKRPLWRCTPPLLYPEGSSCLDKCFSGVC